MGMEKASSRPRSLPSVLSGTTRLTLYQTISRAHEKPINFSWAFRFRHSPYEQNKIPSLFNVFGVCAPKALFQSDFLDMYTPTIPDTDRQEYREQTHPIPERQAYAENRNHRSGVGRVAKIPVRPGSDEFMVVLNKDNGTKIFPQCLN